MKFSDPESVGVEFTRYRRREKATMVELCDQGWLLSVAGRPRVRPQKNWEGALNDALGE